MGPQARTDLAQQLPEETASLVDRLLDGAGSGETPTVTPPLVDTVEPDMSGARSSMMATESLRHGALDPRAADTPDADVVDIAAYQRSRQVVGTATSAVSAVSATQPAGIEQGHQNALELLARVSAQRGISREQLLALGDTSGAKTLATLDALLAQAGTPAGARLAAQQIMRSTSALSLGERTNTDTTTIAPFSDGRMADMNAAIANAAERAHLRANGASALSAAASTDVASPVKDLETVAPQLRGKVARVIERMKNEYGHDVSIVEASRSQERQDWLYEQGRTRSGPIVTWTRHSAHTRGDAVDVMIDGAWDNAAGFARLQRIASEEGLRTLGMQDPGHLELATGSSPMNPSAAATAKVDRQIPRANHVASSAGAAQVAGVAGVAGVARVAEASGAARIASNGGTTAVDGLAAYTAQPTGRSSNAGNGDASSDTGSHGARDQREAVSRTVRGGSKEQDTPAPAFGTFGNTGAATTAGAERVSAGQAAAGSGQAERVSDLQQMRADTPTGPLSRMTLNVDNANGTRETITVDVRGNTVNTQITTDAATADRIRMSTADLQDALGRRGLESDSIRIGANKAPDASDAARAIAGDREALKVNATQQSSAQDGAQHNGQRERAPAREWDQESARREQASRARDQKQDQQDRQERQRRATPFLGIE